VWNLLSPIHRAMWKQQCPMTRHKRLKCLVVTCNNEYSSRNLLLTSEPLKTQRINISFVLKWMRRSTIYLIASMFTQIIRGPVSSTEEGYYESLQIKHQLANFVMKFSILHWYIYLAFRLFLWVAIRKPFAIFGMVCKSLSALTVCVYNSKLYACISLNIYLLLCWMRDGWCVNVSGAVK